MTERLLPVLLLAAACGSADQDVTGTAVARGRYLVNNVGLCAFCHTPLRPDGTRDTSRLFAGNPCLIDVAPEDQEVGCLPARNLTPHATGVASRSDADLELAIRDGLRPDGTPLAPVMPYWLFHNMTDDDLAAVVAYLRTLTAVDHMVPGPQPPWTGLPAPAPALDPAAIPLPAPSYPEREAAVRGRYLAAMAGLCVDCHTAELAPGDPRAHEIIDRARLFQGNRAFPAEALGLFSPPHPPVVYTSNITPDVATGIGAYGHGELVQLLRSGRDRSGDYLCAATHGGPTSPYAGLTDGDTADIAHYLLSLPPAVAAESGTCVAVQ